MGNPVNGMSMSRECARSTRTLYSLPANRALEYARLINLLCCFVVSSNFDRTYLATAVLPLPVLPYKSRLDGLESCRIGANICPIILICSSRKGNFSGIKSDRKTCLLIKIDLPVSAFSKILESMSFSLFVII